MLLSVSVMAHPSRKVEAESLAESLAGFPVRIVYDPEPDAGKSTVRVAREAWIPWCPEASHHMVIQDDCSLLGQFEAQVSKAVEHQPTAVLSLFSEWGSYTSGAVRIAALGGYAWVVPTDTYVPTQAAIMPTEVAHLFAAYLQDVDLDVPEDHAVFDFCVADGHQFLVSVPHLVEHDGLESLTGNDYHGARHASAPLVGELPDDWWGRPVLDTLTSVPTIHWRTMKSSWRVRTSATSFDWSGVATLPSDSYEILESLATLRATELSHILGVTDEPAAAIDAAFVTLARQADIARDLQAPTLRPVRWIEQQAIRTALPGPLRLLGDDIPWGPMIDACESTGFALVDDVRRLPMNSQPFPLQQRMGSRG